MAPSLPADGGADDAEGGGEGGLSGGSANTSPDTGVLPANHHLLDTLLPPPLSADPVASSTRNDDGSSTHSVRHMGSSARLAESSTSPNAAVSLRMRGSQSRRDPQSPQRQHHEHKPSALREALLTAKDLIVRKDAGIFYFGLALIMAPCAVFSHFVIPDMKHYSVATLVVFICIWTLCVATMFRTSFTDPGFLPQNLDPDPELHDLPSSASGISTLRSPETAAVSAYQKQNPTNPANFATSSVTTTSTTPPEHNGQQQHQQQPPSPPQPPAATASSSSLRAPPAPPPSLPQGYPFITNANLPAYSMPFNPDPRTVYVNGIPLSVKFCVTCRIWRPPRASHCSVCDRCVSNHDHHCPWMANCVGKNNYKYFYGFICTTALLAAYVFIFSLVALIRRARENGDGVETGVEGDAIGFWSAVEDKPANLVLMVYTFVIGWTVFGMAAYHTWIACNAFTTHEQIKERVRFDNSRITGTEHVGKSPFDRGNGCANWVWVICREGDVRFENWPADLEAGYLSGTMAMPPPPTTPTPGQVHPERSTT